MLLMLEDDEVRIRGFTVFLFLSPFFVASPFVSISERL